MTGWKDLREEPRFVLMTKLKLGRSRARIDAGLSPRRSRRRIDAVGEDFRAQRQPSGRKMDDRDRMIVVEAWNTVRYDKAHDAELCVRRSCR